MKRHEGCIHEGCREPFHARERCRQHYGLFMRNGASIVQPRRSFDERLWANIDVGHPLGCWEWTGSKDPLGYGGLHRRRKGRPAQYVRAHRAVYEKLRGPIPEGFQIDHLCRNTGCVNPDHLEVVTAAENTRRKPTVKHRKQCSKGHYYTPENTYKRKGRNGRACRRCQAEANRQYRQRQAVKPDA